MPARQPASFRARTGPVPDSSCLKYTKASRHSARVAIRGPPGELRRLVGAIAKAQVAEVRGRRRRGGACLGVGDAEGRVPGAEDPVHLVVEPRGMAELDGHADGRGHPREAGAKTAGILPEVRGQLEEERTELGAEPARPCRGSGEGLGDVTQAGEVGDPLWDLQGEDEPRRGVLVPAGDRLRVGIR